MPRISFYQNMGHKMNGKTFKCNLFQSVTIFAIVTIHETIYETVYETIYETIYETYMKQKVFQFDLGLAFGSGVMGLVVLLDLKSLAVECLRNMP